jgi:glycosyltransferase involved in cell wall biosynthesis
MRFKILVAARNCRPYLERSLASLAAQTDDAYDVCVVDDASDDPGQWPLIRDTCNRYGWKSVRRDHRMGALYNQYTAANLLEPAADDVLVFYDGDDQFWSASSLSVLRACYERTEPLVTFGSYECVPRDFVPTPAQEFPRSVIEQNAYRAFSARDDYDAIWFNHLRTVRWHIFDRIDPVEEFCFSDGSWFMTCCDTAVMIPSLELAGGRHQFIPDFLYRYTRDNPLSDCRVNLDDVSRVHHRIFHELAPRLPIDEIVVPDLLSEPVREDLRLGQGRYRSILD